MNRDDSFRMIPADIADRIVFCASLAVLIFFALPDAARAAIAMVAK